MLVARDQRAALKPLGLSLLAARAIVALQLLLVLSNAAVPARQGYDTLVEIHSAISK